MKRQDEKQLPSYPAGSPASRSSHTCSLPSMQKTAPSIEGERGFGQIGSCAGTGGDQDAPNHPMGTSTRKGKIARAKQRIV